MIKVTVLEDSDRVVRELKLTGHAGYGEEGQDIVCAAVSALVFSAYNSIETFTEDDLREVPMNVRETFSCVFQERSVRNQNSL